MAAAGMGDRGDVRALLADQTFWDPDGRIGVITQGKYTNRLILFYPEPTPGHWTEVVSSSREEGPLDAYIVADEYAANVLEEYAVVWLARSKEEAPLEEKVFGWRQTFRLPRESLKQRLIKPSGETDGSNGPGPPRNPERDASDVVFPSSSRLLAFRVNRRPQPALLTLDVNQLQG